MVISFKYPFNNCSESYDNVSDIKVVQTRNKTHFVVAYFDRFTHFNKNITVDITAVEWCKINA